MPSAGVCPRCHAPLPGAGADGLCLSCLGRLALEAPDDWGGGPDATGEEGAFDLEPFEGRPARRFGDYELLEEVACGGMGVVYRARQISLERIVALKMVMGPQLGNPQVLRRFQLEAAAAGRLQHPHIVAIHDAGEIAGQPFYTMDFVEGQSLAQRVRQAPLPPRQAAGYLKAIAEAVHHAHQRGVLHRDLKPSNILIDHADQPRITDFGLAKLMLGETELTLTGEVMGSPGYMAPEQAEGRWRDVSVRSDVYGLGATLYELLTGRPPFRADTAVATLKQVVENEPADPRVVNPKVAASLAAICLKCLDKVPARRYGTAQELADDLARFLRGEPTLAQPLGPVARARRWCGRNPGLARALGLAALATVFGVGAIAWQWHREGGYRRQAQADARTTRRHLYAADVYAAQQALLEQNHGLARRLLSAHRPAPGEEDLRGFEWRHLWSQLQGDQLHVLPGHSNIVTALAFSPDRRFLASAGREGFLRVWDVRARVVKVTRSCLPGHVYRLAFSSDGRQLALGAKEGVQLWDTESWQETGRLTVPSAALAFAPAGSLLAVGESNVLWGTRFTGSVRLWDTARGEAVLCLTNAGGRVAFSRDGRLLATGNWDDEIRLWEMPAGRLWRTLTHGLRLLGLEFSPDSQFLGTLQWDHGPRLWSVPDARDLGPLGTYTSRVRALTFSPDSRLAAVAGAGQTVDLWETATRTLVTRLRGHEQEIWSLAFSPDGALLASGGRDNGVFLWDVEHRAPPNTLTGLVERLGAPTFALSRGGGQVAACTAHGVGVWGTARLQPAVASLPGEIPLAFFPDDRRLLTLCPPASAVTWDLATTQAIERVELAVPYDCYNDCRLSPSGRWIVLGDNQGRLHLIDRRTGRSLAEARPHSRYVLALDINRDETLAASSDLSGDGFLWELPALRPRGVLRGHTDYIRGLAFAAAGDRLATASADGTARIWSVPEGRQLALLRGHSEELNDAAFSPDGRTLATSSYDGTVRLWHVPTSREMAVLRHEDRVLHLRFSADGEVLAALSRAGSVRFWHASRPDVPGSTGPGE